VKPESSKLESALALLRYRPVVPIAMGLFAGICMGAYTSLPLWIAPVGTLIGICAGLGLSFFKTHRLSGLVAAAFLFWGIGFFMMARLEHPILPPNHVAHFNDGKRVTLQGKISQPLRFFNDYTLAFVTVSELKTFDDNFMPIIGSIRLRINEPDADLRQGDKIQFSSKLRFLSGFSTPGSFDRETFYKHRSVFSGAYVSDAHDLIVIQESLRPLQGRFESFRNRLRTIVQNSLSHPENEILIALVLGERERIPDDIRDTFTKGGVAHLLAISGMHIGSIFGLAYLLLSRIMRFSAWLCRRFNIFKVSAALSVLPVIFYAEMAGWRVSTFRAFIMVLVFAISILLGKQRDLLTTLSLAAITILLIWPFSILEPGFQLSFSSVLAISILSTRLRKAFPNKPSQLEKLGNPSWWKTPARWVFFATASTFAAVLVTIPITVYHFGTITPYAFIGNLVMIPLYTLLVVPMLLLGSLTFIVSASAAVSIFSLTSYGVEFGLIVTRLVSMLPASVIHLSRPVFIEITTYYLTLCILLFYRKKWGWVIIGLSVFTLVALPVAFHLERKFDKELKFTVLDVGQGISQLIEFPGGETWLIDGGGLQNPEFDIGEYVVGPFLRSKRIRTIDNLVCSHPHPDHFGGLTYVLKNFNVKRATLSDLKWEEDDRYDELRKIAVKNVKGRIDILSSDLPDETIGGVKVKWLYPPPDVYNSSSPMSYWSMNDQSATLRLVSDSCTLLITSDIEELAEKYLLQSTIDLKADVMTCPHHGSKSSSSVEFLHAVNPKSVIISVGRYNWWGLPTAKVLNRYKELGIDIYRTDINGLLECRCKDGGFHVMGKEERNGQVGTLQTK